jgi:hypothetical protein
MGGGSMQLAAYGKQDVHLTGNPQMTFFKYVYKRYSNFAIESVEHSLDTANSVDENKTVVTINSHSGDLISKVHLQVEFTAGLEMISGSNGKTDVTKYLSFTNETGWAFVKEASISIGDQEIDKHYSEWFDIWNELSDNAQKEHLLVNKHNAKKSYYEGIKNQEAAAVDQVKYIEADDKLICYIPLHFWFNRNPGLALPIIALQYHEIKFHFTFRRMTALFNSNAQAANNPNIAPKVNLFIDFIYLDKEERRKFATEKHQYLIEQLQRMGPESLSTTHNLNFNHPVKELVWVCRNKKAGTEATDLTTQGSSTNGVNNLSSVSENNWAFNDFFNFVCPDRGNLARTEVLGGNKSYEPYEFARLTFNGVDRFTKRRPSYFRVVQPSTHHSRIPTKHIYCYSFALRPEDFQPSGTCNFSQIHNAQLLFENISTNGNMELIVFAVNYNQLCIMNGMAGLRYSN